MWLERTEDDPMFARCPLCRGSLVDEALLNAYVEAAQRIIEEARMARQLEIQQRLAAVADAVEPGGSHSTEARATVDADGRRMIHMTVYGDGPGARAAQERAWRIALAGMLGVDPDEHGDEIMRIPVTVTSINGVPVRSSRWWHRSQCCAVL